MDAPFCEYEITDAAGRVISWGSSRDQLAGGLFSYRLEGAAEWTVIPIPWSPSPDCRRGPGTDTKPDHHERQP